MAKTKTQTAKQVIDIIKTTRDPKVVRKFREDQRVEVRRAAWRSGLNAATPKASFARHASDQDPEVRHYALRAAQAANIRLPYATIMSAVSDEDDDIAIPAIHALRYRAYTYPAHLRTVLCDLAAGKDARAEAAAGEIEWDDLRRIATSNPASAAWRVVRQGVEGEITGPTEFEGLYSTSSLERTDWDVEDGDALVLLHVEGWQKYGRQPARYRKASYLGGLSSDGTDFWAVRVPGSITSVRDALDAITPTQVKRAKYRGKKVIRQGDLYAVETTKAHDTPTQSIRRHAWDQETRILSHPEHAAVKIPFPVHFFEQHTLPMWGSGVVYGD